MDDSTVTSAVSAADRAREEIELAQQGRFVAAARLATVAGAMVAVLYLSRGAYIAATEVVVTMAGIEAVRAWVVRGQGPSREARGTQIWLGLGVINMVANAATVGQDQALTIWWIAIVPMIASYLASIRVGAQWLVICVAAIVAVHSLPLWLDVPQELVPGSADRMLVQIVMMVAVYFFARSHLLTLARQVEVIRAQSVELEQARDEALAASRAKTEFLAIVSHEVRNPLHGVIAGLEIVTADANGRSDRQLAAVRAAADEAKRVVDNILDFSQLEFTRVAVEERPFRVADLFGTTVEVVAPIAKQKDLAIAYDISSGFPGHVSGDAGKLRQMLLNIVGNSVKFTPAGGSIGLEASWDDGVATLEVWDTGIGIAPEDQKRIFDKFEQADGGTVRRYGGTGLGLSITRELAGLLDCDISIKSRPGEGVRFTLRLPLPKYDGVWAPALPRLAAFVPDPGYDPAERGPDGGPLVLVVDDHAVNAAIAGDMLELLGCRSIWAPDGQAAVDALETRTDIAAILLDLHLPGMHGAEVARRARALRGPELPIVVLTADLPAVTASNSQKTDADVYLAKPARIAALRDALRVLGLVEAPFRVSGLTRARGILASDNPTDEDLALVSAEIDDACDRAVEFTARLQGGSDETLHFRAHRHLLNSLLTAKQLLGDGRLDERAQGYLIGCLDRATRWDDPWD